MKGELSKLWGIFFMGIWVMLIPAWGIPREYLNTLTVVSGACIVALSFLLARGIAYRITTHDEDRP